MKAIPRLALGMGSPTAILLLLAAASSPSALARVEGGLWEISRPGAQRAKQCIASPVVLAQLEHWDSKCTSTIVRDSGSSATIHYTCSGGGYGQTSITVVTDRSLRVETQGISGNAPFKYVFQARRVGDCPVH